MDNRVVITGLGIMSCAGQGVADNWEMAIEGRSGIGPITLCDTDILPTKIAAEVKGFKPKEYIDDRKSLKVMYRNVRLGMAAAKVAFQDSGLDRDEIDPVRFGAFVGSGGCGFDEGPDNKDMAEVIKVSWNEEMKNFDSRKFGIEGVERLYPLWLLKTLCNNVFCYISIYYNAQGVNDNVVNSFVGGSQAVGDGFKAIRRGDADVAFAGGYDMLIMPNNFFCYDSLGMLTKGNESLSSFRPFDRRRDGFVLGEGSGMVIMESMAHAKKRGARIYCEVAGYGSSANAASLHSPCADGRGMSSAIKMALRDSSGVQNIDYINADGIGTVESDRAETNAVKCALGGGADRAVISSTKPVFGHTGSAAGAIEAVICAKSISENLVPPTVNLEDIDEECDLDYCPGEAREVEVNTALSLNQGIGGQNTALIFRRHDM